MYKFNFFAYLTVCMILPALSLHLQEPAINSFDVNAFRLHKYILTSFCSRYKFFIGPIFLVLTNNAKFPLRVETM